MREEKTQTQKRHCKNTQIVLKYFIKFSVHTIYVCVAIWWCICNTFVSWWLITNEPCYLVFSVFGKYKNQKKEEKQNKTILAKIHP